MGVVVEVVVIGGIGRGFPPVVARAIGSWQIHLPSARLTSVPPFFVVQSAVGIMIPAGSASTETPTPEMGSPSTARAVETPN